MSLYGMMRTGVSGMNAQSVRLGTVADNIANSGTNGYKRASVEFSSLVIPNTGTSYVSGGVATQVRYSISQAGNLQYTTSTTDLALQGNGFFLVQDGSGKSFLTRAGSFVPITEKVGAGDNAQEVVRLVNAAGFYLAGVSPDQDGNFNAPANGTGGIGRVEIPTTELERAATTFGKFSANLPYSAEIVSGNTPANNAADSSFTQKTSLVVVDNAGREVMLDLYFTKTAAGEWEMALFHQPDPTATASFPYMESDGVTPAAPLATFTLAFDASGELTGIQDSASNPVDPANLQINLASINGDEMALDMSSMTQFATSYTLLEATVNGSTPSPMDQVLIGSDGVVYAEYVNGVRKPLFKLPIAMVRSPDQLDVLPGNVFVPGIDSGELQVDFAERGGRGAILTSAVENSNVDIAEELTNMIESQRNYTANSKVFQTGSDLMDVLVNLKR